MGLRNFVKHVEGEGLGFCSKGGAVELHFACGGIVECGFAFWRKEKTEEGEGRELHARER